MFARRLAWQAPTLNKRSVSFSFALWFFCVLHHEKESPQTASDMHPSSDESVINFLIEKICHGMCTRRVVRLSVFEASQYSTFREMTFKAQKIQIFYDLPTIHTSSSSWQAGCGPWAAVCTSTPVLQCNGLPCQIWSTLSKVNTNEHGCQNSR